MFAEFTGVNPDTYVPLINANGIPSQIELDRRKASVTERVREIARAAGISPDTINNIEVTFKTGSLGLRHGSAEIKGKKIIINLTGFLLLDFKKDFLIQDQEDFKAKIANSQWLQEFSDKYVKIHNFPPIKLNESNKSSMKQLFSRLLDPEKEALAQLFVVLHELGHIHHRHIETSLFSIIFKVGTIALLANLIFAFIKKNMVLVVKTETLMALMIGAFMLYQKIVRQKNEKSADLFALNALKGGTARKVQEGAIHYFEKSIEEDNTYQKNRTKWQVIWDGIKYISQNNHPVSESRLQMARQFVEQH